MKHLRATPPTSQRLQELQRERSGLTRRLRAVPIGTPEYRILHDLSAQVDADCKAEWKRLHTEATANATPSC